MSRVLGTSPSWKAHRNSHQYVLELPQSMSGKTVAHVLHQSKLQRKQPGVLSVRCIEPGVTKMSGGRSRWYWLPTNISTEYLLVLNSLDVASALSALIRIDAILHQACGAHITRVIQRLPISVARFVSLHAVNIASSCMQVVTTDTDSALDRNDPVAFLGHQHAGALLYLRKPSVVLMVAVQQIFELNGVGASFLGIAKALVWNFLGGSMHELGVTMQLAGDSLQDTITQTCTDFQYALLLSIRLHPPQEAALCMAERCGVGISIVEQEAFCWDLQVCGKRASINLALERLRAARSSAFPNCIVIREAPLVNTALWRLAFGPTTTWKGLKRSGINKGCLVYRECCWDCCTPSSKAQWEKLVKLQEVLVLGTRDYWRVVGTAAGVSDFLWSAEKESRLEEVSLHNAARRNVLFAYDGIEEAENGSCEGGYLTLRAGQPIEVLSKPHDGHTRNRHDEYVFGRAVSILGEDVGRRGWLPTNIIDIE